MPYGKAFFFFKCTFLNRGAKTSESLPVYGCEKKQMGLDKATEME